MEIDEPSTRQEKQNKEQQSGNTEPGRFSPQGSIPISSPPVLVTLLGRLLLALIAGVCVAFLSLPLIALLLRVPLDSLLLYLADPVVTDALRLSGISSLCTLALIILFGTPVAYLLGRVTFRGKGVLETLIELPLVLPPAVAGVALLFAFGRRTPLGGLLHTWNLDVAFTLAAVVLAQTFVAAPFYIKSARAGFQGVPRETMEAARTDGANGLQVFGHVVVPLAMPGIAGGAIMSWARAVGEFGATILFAGNFQGRTQTMPLAIYTALESDINAAIVLSSILVITSFTVLLVFKLLTGRSVDVLPE
ncbi:MAG: ABC transporter permease [Chloroflexota bacterium]|nr:ABC transporter permease [Chloroflexota bacterium]